MSDETWLKARGFKPSDEVYGIVLSAWARTTDEEEWVNIRRMRIREDEYWESRIGTAGYGEGKTAEDAFKASLEDYERSLSSARKILEVVG